MSEQEKQENQKTIVAFAAGLLIGGLLVWVFGGSPKTEPVDESVNEQQNEVTETTEVLESENSSEVTESKPVMQVGEGKVDVKTQAAGTKVTFASATFPTDEGWMGVRDYVNGQPAGLLGVARYSKAQGLIPTEVVLQRATKTGSEYAVVFYKESGDRKFSLANDVQVEGVFATFKAN